MEVITGAKEMSVEALREYFRYILYREYFRYILLRNTIKFSQNVVILFFNPFIPNPTGPRH